MAWNPHSVKKISSLKIKLKEMAFLENHDAVYKAVEQARSRGTSKSTGTHARLAISPSSDLLHEVRKIRLNPRMPLSRKASAFTGFKA